MCCKRMALMEAGTACRQSTGWLELALHVLAWGPGQRSGGGLGVDSSPSKQVEQEESEQESKGVGKSGTVSRRLWEVRFAPPKRALLKVPYHLVLAESHSRQVSLLDFSMGSDTENLLFSNSLSWALRPCLLFLIQHP